MYPNSRGNVNQKIKIAIMWCYLQIHASKSAVWDIIIQANWQTVNLEKEGLWLQAKYSIYADCGDSSLLATFFAIPALLIAETFVQSGFGLNKTIRRQCNKMDIGRMDLLLDYHSADCSDSILHSKFESMRVSDVWKLVNFHWISKIFTESNLDCCHLISPFIMCVPRVSLLTTRRYGQKELCFQWHSKNIFYK